MKQEEKNLLLKDLCERLPYGIRVMVVDEVGYEHILPVYGYLFGTFRINGSEYDVDEVKPYLRPLSSMTEEEREYLRKNHRFYYDNCSDGITNGIYSSQFNRIIYEMIDQCDISNIIDWLNANHFDYRGLIEKGLAIEAPEDMYKTEQ